MNKEKLYKRLNKKIDYLMDYYLDWQDYIERFSYPRMDYHYLIVNISSFYTMLNIAKNNLSDWYNNKTKLIYSLICIPNKIKLSSNIYNNILIIKKSLDYNDKVFLFFLEKNKKN